MEINGWTFALIATYLIIRNAWKYMLIFKLGGFKKQIEGMLPHGKDNDGI